MLSDYLPILIMLVAASAIGIGGAVISWVAGPKQPSANKAMAYESGMIPVGTARIRFPVKFYLVAMLFIIFDVEIVFFYPWAVVYKQLHLFGFVEMLVFIGVFAVGYIYIWKKGALDWK
ncbi:MAG: NADH-quinone oxidoreductase subunit A [Chloroflexi bacterium]|nr:NADH-quinone oxidoreductase subunit A [Chloroflexota bacterium]